MHFSSAAVVGLTALSSYAAAQGGLAFTTVPNNCQVGQSCTIEWEGAGGAVRSSLYMCRCRPRASVSDTSRWTSACLGTETLHCEGIVDLANSRLSPWKSSCVRVIQRTSTLWRRLLVSCHLSYIYAYRQYYAAHKLSIEG